MQYILTQEEFDNLISKSKYEEKCNQVKNLQMLLLKVSNFKCIHDRTQEDEEEYGDEFYCDYCPLAHFKPGYDCGKRKNFSQ